jgi:hypothetical protein
VENGLNDSKLTVSWCLNEDVQVTFFNMREHIRQSQEGVQRFEIIDAFESFVGIVIYRYGDVPEVKIGCSDVIKVRSLHLFNQIFEYADIFRLPNFDSERLHQVVTKYNLLFKAVEREKLGGIENWNRLSHFQRDIRCGSKMNISATYQETLQ